MEFGPTTLIFLLVVFAAGTAVMLIMMGKWLDLTGYKYKMETQRNAMNLAQLIVSNSPIVENNDGEPNKLILNAERFARFDDYIEYRENPNPDPDPDNWKGEWERCCDFLGFDHDLKIIAFNQGADGMIGTSDDGEDEWPLTNIIFKEESKCYPKRVKGMSDIPIVVKTNGDYIPGVLIVNLSRTVLTELSFWLSQAFIRAYWDSYWDLYPEEKIYKVHISLDPEIRGISLYDFDEEKKRVCVHVDRNGDGTDEAVACKNFIFKTNTYPSNNPINWSPDDSLVHTGDCVNVIISVEKNDGSRTVSIIYPGV